MYKIFPSSEKVLQNNRLKSKYPWRVLEIGKSFSVPHAEISLAVLRSAASRHGKKLNRIFRVYDHGSEVGYEVARLAEEPFNVGTSLSSAENNAPALSLEAPSPKPAVEIASWLQPRKEE